MCVVRSFRFNTRYEIVLCRGDLIYSVPARGPNPRIALHSVPPLEFCSCSIVRIGLLLFQYVDLGRNNSGSNMKNFGAPPPLTQMKKKKPNTVLESVIWSIDGFLICCKYFPLVFNCIVCVPLHMSIRELFSRHRQTIFISRSFLQPTRN